MRIINIKMRKISEREEMKKELLSQLRKNLQFNSYKPFIVILFIFILHIVQYLCSYFFSIFIKQIKNDKPIIGFSNIYYNGNPRAVFEYMLKNDKNFDIFWAAKNIKSIKEVRNIGGKVFLINSLFGIPYFLKTDIWIVSHGGMGNIPYIPHRNYKLIQLKHGVGPKGTVHSKEEFDKYDAWCVSSEFIKKRHIELWDAPPKKIISTGFARMDMLFNYLREDKKILLKEIGIENNGKKIFLHAPTFDLGLWPWGDQYHEFNKLCHFTNLKRINLILRLHPYSKINRRKINSIIKKYNNVYWLDTDKEPDTMKLLSITDLLITDWSSIYTDFLITKNPIIFLEPDMEFFTINRGKPEVPPEFRPGVIVHSTDEFYQSLNNVLEKGNSYLKQQKEIFRLVHGNFDGKNSERFVSILEKLIEKN